MLVELKVENSIKRSLKNQLIFLIVMQVIKNLKIINQNRNYLIRNPRELAKFKFQKTKISK